MEKLELAELICNELTPEEWGEMASVLFDQAEVTYTPEGVEEISAQLLTAGVDVRPLCRKKHPA